MVELKWQLRDPGETLKTTALPGGAIAEFKVGPVGSRSGLSIYCLNNLLWGSLSMKLGVDCLSKFCIDPDC